jgi:hypothetical protein
MKRFDGALPSLHGRNARLCGLVILQRGGAAHANCADDFSTDDYRHASGGWYHAR